MSLDTPVPETAAEAGLSRRGLIRNATAIGAVGLTAGLLSGLGTGSAAADPADPGEQAADPDAAAAADAADPETSTEQTPTVVHLRNARTGELDVFHGQSHRRVQDRELADALLRTLG
ncbi:hypothetical protein P3T37_004110 [Kitasatospora sp. MAA4]|uniref:hypothetical protein n=1 Tax=Kitasatospora sp. MAA4 TaxID=3035093 RepID=UPI002474546D|nr:hypothetical protein [Kitasatospora sp. MAA4]MDH6134706.1 hypothetical protein [Kitasatospora sp. MAA4]